LALVESSIERAKARVEQERAIYSLYIYSILYRLALVEYSMERAKARVEQERARVQAQCADLVAYEVRACVATIQDQDHRMTTA
jgi:hypothetical protein